MGEIREFETGATRDTDKNKPDYEGFFSPLTVRRFGEYMNECRKQSNGELRDSDNWQKGIPKDEYMKSGWRHHVDLWTLHRGFSCADEKGEPVDIEKALCAIIFNAQGYLHELLKAKEEERGEE